VILHHGDTAALGSADRAQQSAKACQDLSGLVLDLQKMVANFKLASNRSRSAPHNRRMPSAGEIGKPLLAREVPPARAFRASAR